MNKQILISIVILAITGCSSVSLKENSTVEGIEKYIPNFPTLSENIVYLSYPEMIDKCGKHKPPGKEMAKVYGCSAIDLSKKTCTIYLPTNYESWALAHEKEHCKGGDHDDLITDYYKKWQKLEQQKGQAKNNENKQ